MNAFTPGPSRRRFLAMAANSVGCAFARRFLAVANDAAGGPGVPGTQPSPDSAHPLIHTTDLFRPHNDPDDHWDLATSYALASRGLLEILGVLVDDPANIEELPGLSKEMDKAMDAGLHQARSPDVAAVAQMNYLTDQAVPTATGSLWPDQPGEMVRADNLPGELRGVNMLLEVLRRSPKPVKVLVGGSCQDVAVAGKKEPSLFAAKCAGVYLAAGIGSPNPADQVFSGGVEWNVNLNQGAYAATFELPCPIYWMPCFNRIGAIGVGDYGTYWSFQYSDVVPFLSPRLQAYFACVLNREYGTNWLSYLVDAESPAAAQKFLNDRKGMWSTAGFVHAAGRMVTTDGDLVPLGTPGARGAYEFLPIQVRCDRHGLTKWELTQRPTNRYIFHVTDNGRYADAMRSAFKSMLLGLG